MKLLENVIRAHEGKPYPGGFVVQWKSLPTYADVAELEAELSALRTRLERLESELAAILAENG